jgi:putative peptide zinc metalloprotease protein
LLGDDKLIIEQLGHLPLSSIASEYNISRDKLRYLWQLLTATAMFEGTKPPKPPKRKFHPLQLLSFKIRLFNPDPWLTRHVDKLRWIWTASFCWLVCFFLAISAVIGMNESNDIFITDLPRRPCT